MPCIFIKVTLYWLIQYNEIINSLSFHNKYFFKYTFSTLKVLRIFPHIENKAELLYCCQQVGQRGCNTLV